MLTLLGAMPHIWNNDSVDTSSRLWRYFKAERFLKSLATKTLYFASATQFEDPFEGAVGFHAQHTPEDELADFFETAFAQLRRLTKISCWHRADNESDAMWRLYAGQGKGLAVITSVDRLVTSLQPYRLAPHYGEERAWYGYVRYIDFASPRDERPSKLGQIGRASCRERV